MRSPVIRNLMLILGVIYLSACDTNRLYDDYHSFPGAVWMKDSVQTYTFDIARKTENYNIYFNIRNDQTYGFSNLWLFVAVGSPKGDFITDTIQVILAEPSGKWSGKGSAGVYDNRFIYRRNVFFPESGEYSIHLQHGMRPDNLKGVTDIGIRIEKANVSQ